MNTEDIVTKKDLLEMEQRIMQALLDRRWARTTPSGRPTWTATWPGTGSPATRNSPRLRRCVR